VARPRHVLERRCHVARLGFLESLWLTRFSRPAAERAIYRTVLRSPPQRILEIGLGTLLRTRGCCVQSAPESTSRRFTTSVSTASKGGSPPILPA